MELDGSRFSSAKFGRAQRNSAELGSGAADSTIYVKLPNVLFPMFGLLFRKVNGCEKIPSFSNFERKHLPSGLGCRFWCSMVALQLGRFDQIWN